MKNYYAILEVSESASPEMIKAAYVLLIRRYHPDNQETGDSERAKEITAAYNVLRDPQRKQAHDADLADDRRRHTRPQYPRGSGPMPDPFFIHVDNPNAYPVAYGDLGEVARDVLIDASFEIGNAFINTLLANVSPFARKAFLDALDRRRNPQQGKKAG